MVTVDGAASCVVVAAAVAAATALERAVALVVALVRALLRAETVSTDGGDDDFSSQGMMILVARG